MTASLLRFCLASVIGFSSWALAIVRTLTAVSGSPWMTAGCVGAEEVLALAVVLMAVRGRSCLAMGFYVAGGMCGAWLAVVFGCVG